MDDQSYEFVIVGSGAGGATLARELSARGKQVLIVEKGHREDRIGNFRDALRYFDANPLTRTPARSKEGVILWRTFMAGGTTVVSSGNALRCLERELGESGITLDEEFSEAEREMNVQRIDAGLISEASERILEAAQALDYKMEPMPKFINPVKCQKCGLCPLGCAYDARWTALDYLDEAIQNGADVLYDTTVELVLHEKDKVKGVRGIGPRGQVQIAADAVILAAGGLGTPIILQRSGIEKAGHGLFVDIFVNTYGVTDRPHHTYEPSMTLVDHEFHQSKGFILSTHVNLPRMVRFMEIGVKGFALPTRRLMGIMTKIVDEPVGSVYPDGTVSKPVTERDRTRLHEGSSIAREILITAGADEKSIVVSNPQGAHPGGTAAIGQVVDARLQTRVDGLYVCDASVFPAPPGAPPILTIVALAKRLAKTLAS